MKITLKSLFLLLSALLAVSVSYSCRKSSDAEPAAEAPAEITPLTVIGRIGGANTKVTYTVGDTKISQTWAVDDTIIGISSADSTYTYVVSKVNSDGTASFSLVKGGGDSRYGTATVNPSVGTKMHMIYAPGYAAKDLNSGTLSIDISTQDTTVVGTSASGLHIPAIMTATGEVSGDNKLELTFANQLELLMIKNPTFSGCATGTSITSFTVFGSGTLPTTATFSASGFTVGSGNGTVTKNFSLSTTATGTTTGTVLIALLPASTQNLYIKSSNSYADTITSHTPTASKLLKVSGATFKIDTSCIGIPVAIDTVIWAQYNCGYEPTNYKYGLLYQWGRKYGQAYETGTITPTAMAKSDDKETNKDKFGQYDSSTYNWFSGTFDNALWNGSSKGTSDPCPTGWRVPTEAEFTALISQKAWGNNTVGTVSQTGYWFNGSSAASEGTGVFLPAAGCRYYGNGSADFRGYDGYYWSSSVYGNYAEYLFFFNGYAYMYDSSRAYGYSVRCVQE